MLRRLLARYRAWRYGPPPHSLPDPFRAEVLLDGEVVATLTDRVFVDMFWHSYRIERAGASTAIDDDSLWDRCRFTFRDPATGMICTCGFVGGRRPFVQDGRVTLRAMYFAAPAMLPAAIAR